MGGIVQVCCGGKHPCRCVGPASALRGFNGVLHSVHFLHNTKRPRVRLITVPCLNSSYRSHHFFTVAGWPPLREGAILPSSTLFYGRKPTMSFTTIPLVF